MYLNSISRSRAGRTAWLLRHPVKSREFPAKDERLITADEAQRYRTTVASRNHRTSERGQIANPQGILRVDGSPTANQPHPRCAHGLRNDALVGGGGRWNRAWPREVPMGHNAQALVDAKSAWPARSQRPGRLAAHFGDPWPYSGMCSEDTMISSQGSCGEGVQRNEV